MSVLAGGKITAADVLAIIAGSTQKPLVRLIQQSAQSIPSDTDTALTFGAASEDIDTNGFHDTGTFTTRITPNVAGYYRLTGTVWWAANTDVISHYASIGKNGAIVARDRRVLPSTATSSLTRSVTVTVMQQANGSTDYFEVFARQLQAAAGSLSTGTGSGFASTFECELLRYL